MKRIPFSLLLLSLLATSCGGTSTTSSIGETSSTRVEPTVSTTSEISEAATSQEESSEESSDEASEETPESSIEESSEEFSEESIDMAPIDKELRACFNYFNDTTNLSDTSNGYGLVQDRYTNKQICSIAATGFALASYPVFVEEGFLTKEEGEKRAKGTLDTILRIQADESTSYAGCISHFVNRRNGSRNGTSEVSTIDTAILISGALTAGEYFKGEVLEKAMEAWSNVDFTSFVVKKNSKSYISMGVNDPSEKKQLSPWDYYAEQLMIYILGAGNPDENHRIPALYYKNITKKTGSFGGVSHVYSWYGSLFTYQYSHAFFNFKDYDDYNGRNWFENSVHASQTNYAFCKSLADTYASFDSPGWGLSACDSPLGYSGLLGAAPRGWDGYNDTDYLLIQGTITPCAAIGSLPFTPRESYDALVYFQSLNGLNDPSYGIRDSYNLDFRGTAWYDPDFIGIDKGIEVLQLYNFKNPDFVSSLSMGNEYVKAGFLNNEFTEVTNG